MCLFERMIVKLLASVIFFVYLLKYCGYINCRHLKKAAKIHTGVASAQNKCAVSNVTFEFGFYFSGEYITITVNISVLLLLFFVK